MLHGQMGEPSWQLSEKECYLFSGTKFAIITAWLILLFMIAPQFAAELIKTE